MSNLLNKNKSKELILYNKILFLSRNKLFYTKFSLADTFQNRINLIFFHISFIFIKVNKNREKIVYINFHQKLFDLLFYQIELNMRELGHGDITVNKNMKFLVKVFYDILLFCQDYQKKGKEYKRTFFCQYLKSNTNKKIIINDNLIKYFYAFQTFCFDLSSDSVLKGELKFKFD
jgi:cytochrome b pre-mRNA-processing protein 3